MYNKEQVWQQGNAATLKMVSRGMGEYVGGLRDLDKAFHLGDLVVRCMDGRTPGGVHLAGSGILLGLEGSKRFAAEVAEKYGHIEAVTYHRDCGAASAAVESIGGDPFVAGKAFAEELGRALGVESVYEVENEGWEGFHHERAVYYDGTGRFDWKVGDLPAGFVISRAYLDFDVEYAKRELAMACDIALKPHDKGGHGFGELFAPELPLLIVVIAEGPSHLAKLTGEARDVISALPKGYTDRIKVDAFIHRCR